MALIKCSECQTEVSDQATTCPKCAHPFSGTMQPDMPSGIMAALGIGAGLTVLALFLPWLKITAGYSLSGWDILSGAQKLTAMFGGSPPGSLYLLATPACGGIISLLLLVALRQSPDKRKFYGNLFQLLASVPLAIVFYGLYRIGMLLIQGGGLIERLKAKGEMAPMFTALLQTLPQILDIGVWLTIAGLIVLFVAAGRLVIAGKMASQPSARPKATEAQG